MMRSLIGSISDMAKMAKMAMTLQMELTGKMMTTPKHRKHSKPTERPATAKRIDKEKPRYLDICQFLLANRIATHEQIMWWLDLKRQTVDEYLRDLYFHHYIFR